MSNSNTQSNASTNISHMTDRQWCEHLSRTRGEAQAMEIFAVMGDRDGTAPYEFKLYAQNFGPKYNHKKTSSLAENKPVFSSTPRWGSAHEDLCHGYRG